MILKKRWRAALLAGLTIMTVTTAACGGSAPPTAKPPAATTATGAGATRTDTVATATTIKPTSTVTAVAAATKPTSTATKTTSAISATAATAADQAVKRPAGWSEASHGNKANPDYAVVFPQNKVNQITITLTPERWAAMQANMTQLFGAQGTGGDGPGGPRDGRQPPGGGAPLGGGVPPGNAPDGAALPPGGAPPSGNAPGGAPPGNPPGGAPGGGRGGPGGMGGNTDMTPVNPMWISATLTFNGQTWAHVGIRYKGNSTLTRTWRSGSAKLPLKLDFDQFEEEYPEIKNQRFYGFKQLSLANNVNDASYLRDAISYDILEAAGLVTSETAFYEVLLDHGEGPVSLGLYTVIEVVDDTVIARSFADAGGNIYEADGPAASLAAGTAGQIAASFQKENNTAAADWSDIEALYNVLHAAQRTTAPAAWRASLEAVFDVDTFLEWLALNSVIQDWDTYGAMSHNYYLYHNPATDKLVWISWDHNEALSSGGRGENSLDKAGVNANWPLIRYLLDDDVYRAKYIGYLRSTMTDVFDAKGLAQKADTLAELIRPYVQGEGRGQAFDTAVTQLKAFIAQRATAVEAFLSQQN